jgi:hypothetical protein
LSCGNIGRDAVVRLHSTNFPEDTDHGLWIGVANAGKIEIARRTKRVVEPRRYQHCAFQRETVSMRSLAKAVEEPFKHVAGEQKIEGLPGVPWQYSKGGHARMRPCWACVHAFAVMASR